MLAQIEAGKVANCIVKDLSRLGRNSAMTGLYTTLTFPKYGTRFIAINDNFNSTDPNSVNNDFAGINWSDSSVINILKRREYTGCTVNFKTYTNSIWDKKQRENPLENQAVFPDYHERIIEDDVFEKVQETRQQRHRITRSGKTSMFSGLVFCADYGAKMYYGATNNYKPQNAFFDCALHWKDKEKCGTHYIRESVLERLVLHHI